MSAVSENENAYSPIYPTNVAVEDRLKHFISTFYAVSDDPSRNEEWVEAFFAPEAVVKIGKNMARGHNEMRKMRAQMWEKGEYPPYWMPSSLLIRYERVVESRRHKPEKVYPASFPQGSPSTPGQYEYMIMGSVDMEMKDGEEITIPWAARAVVRVCEGLLKYTFYQVYISY
ncbi:hypothetical protein F5Y16DRAFT_396368 [Xylariaceae sp. FL0255]|nr:hypothetical protein F5Y16DRAFT_396368 [Xylariaceae sp. FL0255]